MLEMTCQTVGCTVEATVPVELTESEVPTLEQKWTDVNVCATCHKRLMDCAKGIPATFDGFPIVDVYVLHDGSVSKMGWVKTESLWFITDDAATTDAFDCLNVGLFDKEPITFEIADYELVDVQTDN